MRGEGGNNTGGNYPTNFFDNSNMPPQKLQQQSNGEYNQIYLPDFSTEDNILLMSALSSNENNNNNNNKNNYIQPYMDLEYFVYPSYEQQDYGGFGGSGVPSGSSFIQSNSSSPTGSFTFGGNGGVGLGGMNENLQNVPYSQRNSFSNPFSLNHNPPQQNFGGFDRSGYGYMRSPPTEDIKPFVNNNSGYGGFYKSPPINEEKTNEQSSFQTNFGIVNESPMFSSGRSFQKEIEEKISTQTKLKDTNAIPVGLLSEISQTNQTNLIRMQNQPLSTPSSPNENSTEIVNETKKGSRKKKNIK